MKITERKKLLIYRALLFTFAFVVAFLPSTLSRNLEVNSRVVVEMLGIDGGDGIELTAQYVMPTEGDGASTKDKVSVKADTLTEAVEALNTALGRRAELGQCSVIVVGKELETDVLGTLMTATDVTADVYLTAASDKAKDLIGDITEFMKKSGTTDADFIAYGAKKAHIATATLLNFLSDLDSASHTAYMPIAEVLKEEDSGGGSSGSGGGSESGGSNGGGSSESGGSESGGDKKPIGLKVEKLALYNADGRAGELNRSAARGVAWISAPIDKSVLVADVEHNGEVVNDVSARLIKKWTDIKLDAENDSVTIKLKTVLEPIGDNFNRLSVKNCADVADCIKDGFASEIEQEITSAFNDSLALGCDPMFIGRQFYRFEPKYFNGEFDLASTDIKYVIEVIIK